MDGVTVMSGTSDRVVCCGLLVFFSADEAGVNLKGTRPLGFVEGASPLELQLTESVPLKYFSSHNKICFALVLP